MVKGNVVFSLLKSKKEEISYRHMKIFLASLKLQGDRKMERKRVRKKKFK